MCVQIILSHSCVWGANRNGSHVTDSGSQVITTCMFRAHRLAVGLTLLFWYNGHISVGTDYWKWGLLSHYYTSNEICPFLLFHISSRYSEQSWWTSSAERHTQEFERKFCDNRSLRQWKKKICRDSLTFIDFYMTCSFIINIMSHFGGRLSCYKSVSLMIV